jgi:hypothetical protein
VVGRRQSCRASRRRPHPVHGEPGAHTGVPLRQLFDEDDDEQSWGEVDRVAKALAKYKSSNGLLDYTDMLTRVRAHCGIVVKLDVLSRRRGAGSQPSSVARVFAAGGKLARHVVVAGDDDQAIYRWAGPTSSSSSISRATSTVLGQSWRCPPIIQKHQCRGHQGCAHRATKAWKPRKGKGAMVGRIGMFDEADVTDKWREGEATSPVLVLARNSYILREQVEPLLRAQGMVYELGGKSSLHHEAAGAAESWEALRAGKKVTTRRGALDVRDTSWLPATSRAASRGWARSERTPTSWSP